jgi:hypothetical protein
LLPIENSKSTKPTWECVTRRPEHDVISLGWAYGIQG